MISSGIIHSSEHFSSRAKRRGTSQINKVLIFKHLHFHLLSKRLSKISFVPIKAVERRYYVDCRWCIGKYAYKGTVYNAWNSKYILEGGTEVQLTKLENTTYYTYTSENITYIYDGPTANGQWGGKVGHVGGTQVTLTASTGYLKDNSAYTGPITTDEKGVYGTSKSMEEALALIPVPQGSYTIAENVEDLGYITHICDPETPWASPYTGNGYYYEQGGYKIIYSGRIFYAQDDTEKSQPLGFLNDNTQSQLTIGTIYTYKNAGEESVVYTGTVFGENIGYIEGEDITLTEINKLYIIAIRLCQQVNTSLGNALIF